MTETDVIPVVTEIKPTQDRQCILIVLRANEPIPMKSTIVALEDLAAKLRAQFNMPKSGLVLASHQN